VASKPSRFKLLASALAREIPLRAGGCTAGTSNSNA
jgi:hypothetical protein